MARTGIRTELARHPGSAPVRPQPSREDSASHRSLPRLRANVGAFSTMLLAALLFAGACGHETPATQRIIVLYTNDEHGWMEPDGDVGGAAELAGLWREREGYSEDGPFLLLSGGDMWTGPAISTWFDGEPMVEVMNAMGYDAAALGNHEFDFGSETLQVRRAQAEFPFLSANIRDKATGATPPICVPYVIQRVADVKVGLIGLTTTTTPTSAFPAHVASYDFIDYGTALREAVPRARADGAELLVVVAHICGPELRGLAPVAAELGIALIGGGHCNELIAQEQDGVGLIEGGYWLRSYARAELEVDTRSGKVLSIETGTHENRGGTPDPAVAAAVARWRVRADAELSRVIGYAGHEINVESDQMFNMVTDSWLWAFPAAQISMTNRGGFRQSIPPGDITLGTVVGVLPFDNLLVQVSLSGDQVIDCAEGLVVGGMTTVGGHTLSDGTPIRSRDTYHTLTTDYLYQRPDVCFQHADSTPEVFSVNFRDPVVDWIESLGTSPADPLENHLDPMPRQ